MTSVKSLEDAVTKLHKLHRIPHIIVTSTRLPDAPFTMSVIGSTSHADFSPRIFRIDVPAIDCFFSGTGDMFAALIVVRLCEAVTKAGLSDKKSWISPDEVQARDLPLAKASEIVLGSMHTILLKTKLARDLELEKLGGPLGALEKEKDSEKRLGLRKTKAAEVRVVQCLGDLRDPKVEWKAVAVDERGIADKGPEQGSDQPKESKETEEAHEEETAHERAGLNMQHLAGQNLPECAKDDSKDI